MTDTLVMSEVDDAEFTPQPPVEVVAEPEAEPSLVRQVIPYDDAKVMVRAIKILARYNVGVVNVCLKCKEAKRTTADVAQWARKDDSGELMLNCGCTLRVLDGMRV